jgi:hypothetical protein
VIRTINRNGEELFEGITTRIWKLDFFEEREGTPFWNPATKVMSSTKWLLEK